MKDAISQQETIDSGDEFLAAERAEKSNLASENVLDRGVVLLAEDHIANTLTIREYLEGHGYRIVNARDGLEAIQLAEESNPDIILMDIQMPVMDGLEAMRRLTFQVHADHCAHCPGHARRPGTLYRSGRG